ncbi:histidine kinase-like ATPase, C-terminal domain-containing protein [Tanacetum coccineum]
MTTLCFAPFASATVGRTTAGPSIKSTNMDTRMTNHESSDVVEDIEQILMKTDDSDGFFDPIIRDKQLSSLGNGFWVNEKKEVVSSLSKQFLKAGDDESCGNNNELVIAPAFAEPLDNPLDEVRVHTGATYAKVEVLNTKKDTRSKMLLIKDNGCGMTPDRIQKKYRSTNWQHIGYAEHIKSAPDESIGINPTFSSLITIALS